MQKYSDCQKPGSPSEKSARILRSLKYLVAASQRQVAGALSLRSVS